MTDAQFTDLIARGCAKVNISTALKVTYMQANLEFLRGAEERDSWDPPSLFTAVRGRGARHGRRSHAHVRQRRQGVVSRMTPAPGARSSTATACWPTPSATGICPRSTRPSPSSGCRCTGRLEEYGDKLLIGGGKERMASLLTPEFVAAAGLPADPAGQQAAVAAWHKRKTEIYTELVASGAVPPRPGIARIVGEALAAGWRWPWPRPRPKPRCARCWSGPSAPSWPGSHGVAGDIVPTKKPAPDIYLARAGLARPARRPGVVIEDSRNGLLAATGAGLATVVTVNDFTKDEDFSEAALVVSASAIPAASGAVSGQPQPGHARVTGSP